MKVRIKTICFIFGLMAVQILFNNQLLLASLLEEDNLVSDIWQFFKILFFGVIAIGAGLLTYLMYRKEVKRTKNIEEIKADLNNLRQSTKEKTSDEQSRGRGSKYISSTMEMDLSPPQEISKISQKIETIERQVGDHTNELRNILENSRRQQRVFSLIQDMFKKEILSRENTLQEISNIQKLKSSFEEIGVRNGEPVRQTSQTIKPITEINLLEWWNKSGDKRLSKCKDSLHERFLDVTVDDSFRKNDPEEWRIIGILDQGENIYYVLPRKYGIWWFNYSNKTSDYETWFEVDEKPDDPNLAIRSLSLPLPKAKKTSTGELKLTGQKGKVSIRESQ